MTDAEQHLWRLLRARQLGGHKFRRQHPIGRYIVDFACLEKRLIVEIDGSQHCQQEKSDRLRSYWLTEQGYRVIRFWNNQVFCETDSVIEQIFLCLQSSPPQPSPLKGEGACSGDL